MNISCEVGVLNSLFPRSDGVVFVFSLFYLSVWSPPPPEGNICVFSCFLQIFFLNDAVEMMVELCGEKMVASLFIGL